MRTVRLLRAVNEPTGRGPGNGQFSLQRYLRNENWPWLKIGGLIQPGEIPWVWSWQDSGIAAMFAELGFPFVIGPNVFFADSSRPGQGRWEKQLLDAASCVCVMSESTWYATLIQKHCNHNEAPIVLFRYPIEPEPEGPLPAEYNVLIYMKDMTLGHEVIRMQRRWPNSNLVVYGRYRRETMIDLARKSRATCYLSSDDRGPLAAAEIALAGCPQVGVPCGDPWTDNQALGVQIPHWGEWSQGIEQAMTYDRNAVRTAALEYFSPATTVETIRQALEPIALAD